MQNPTKCVDLDLFTVDEAGKVISDEDTKITVEGTFEDPEDVEKVDDDDDGQEVIKVYIIKAHPGEEDLGKLHSSKIQPPSFITFVFYSFICTVLFSYIIKFDFSGGTVDIGDAELDVDETVELVDSSGMPLREKMVYMSMDEANQSQDDIS